MGKPQKTNGSSDWLRIPNVGPDNTTTAPAPELESVYTEGYRPDRAILAALDEAIETGQDVAMSEGHIARRAAIAEAAVHTLRHGAQVLYVSSGPPYFTWRAVMRLDVKPVGSVSFLFGRPFHGELSARIYAALEAVFGRPGAGSHLHGPHLRAGETCEKVSVDAATVTEINGTAVTWIKYRDLWFSAWHGSTLRRRAAVIDAADPTPAPGQAFPRIAIS